MADFGKIKRSGLGAPPLLDEASQNLRAPELAPVTPELLAKPSSPEPLPAKPELEPGRARRDGRTLRRTNRTIAFATRVSPEFDERLRDIAERDGLKLVEILERALDAYEHNGYKG